MVNLTRIYTRTGDAGSTRLSDNTLVAKTDLRVEAYGAVDEANSVLGLVLAHGVEEPLRSTLEAIQNELFDLGADLSNPVVPDPQWPPLRIAQASIDRLERWCDEYTAGLGDLTSFILPGGTVAGSYLHLARTVTRRAERAAWRAAESFGLASEDESTTGGVNPLAITYLNRLSDLLFIASRFVNGPEAEVLWVPGKDRDVIDDRSAAQRRRIEAAQR